MPRRVIWPVLVVSIGWFLLVGMGTTDGAGPVNIPIPARNYNVTLIDTENVKTRLTSFSVGGLIFFTGRVGKGQVALPFAKMRSIEFRQKGGRVQATASLKKGGTVVMSVSRDTTVSGKVPYGNFRISLGDVRRVVFH